MPVTTQLSSQQFEEDVDGAKEAAEREPVYITDHGRPAHVLLNFAAYRRLVEPSSVVELLGRPDGIEDVEFFIPISDEVPSPASFE